MRWASVVAVALLCACTATPAADQGPPPPSGSTTPSPPPERPVAAPAEVTVAVLGDIMLGRRVAAAHADATRTLRELRPLLVRADVAVGNLESSLSTNGAPTQDPVTDSFSVSPRVLTGLRRAGLDALSLANNHTGDYGEQALVETIEAFEGSPIQPFGAGRDLAEATRAAVVERDGVHIGFLGFNAIGETPMAGPRRPGALTVRMPPRTGPLNRSDLSHVLRAVRRLDRRVDAVIVVPHWGAQYTHTPDPAQTTVGRRLVEAGADLVVGGHPHWVQSTERHRGVTIAHSLGNAVFDMDFSEQAMEGVVLTATVSKDRVGEVELVPYRMDATFTPRLVSGAAARAILADVRSGR